MMNKLLVLLIFFGLGGQVWSQTAPSKQTLVNHYGFEQQEITVNDELIVFYTYQKGDAPKNKMILYLQGSDPSPLFSYQIAKDKQIQHNCFLGGEFRQTDESSIYVVIEKIGFEGAIDENNIPKPTIYQEKNSLTNRVFRADEVIKELAKQHQFKKVIVYGHSEGAPVAARLATKNQQITHLGFWAGNALPDFYDFILESRIAYHKGDISAKEAQKRIDETIKGFQKIVQDSLNTKGDGYTNLRWWTYAEPPINDLLKLNIPIFVQVATEDKSAPIESTYLIPLEFARQGKTNLSYKVCVGCNHSFQIKPKKGKTIRKWQEIFSNFMKWAEEN